MPKLAVGPRAVARCRRCDAAVPNVVDGGVRPTLTKERLTMMLPKAVDGAEARV